ncbi:MAG: hypothetical protein CMM37_00115 [Rhodospirillaceae bacterium]|nr:hypothetical protein [Rhodospirillaceae bacterium]
MPYAQWFEADGVVKPKYADEFALWLRGKPWDSFYADPKLKVKEAMNDLYAAEEGDGDGEWTLRDYLDYHFRRKYYTLYTQEQRPSARLLPSAAPATAKEQAMPVPRNRFAPRFEDADDYNKRLFDWLVPFMLGLLVPRPQSLAGLQRHIPYPNEAPLLGQMHASTRDLAVTSPTTLQEGAQNPLVEPYTAANGRLVVGERFWDKVPEERWHIAFKALEEAAARASGAAASS